MAIIVRNATGGTYDPDVPAGYESWLDYWEKKKGLPTGYCRNCRCCGKHFNSNSDLVGGHVRSVYTNNLYITPLCYECNKPENTRNFSVEETDLVRAP